MPSGLPVWTALAPLAIGGVLQVAGVDPAFAIGALATAVWLVASLIATLLSMAAEP